MTSAVMAWYGAWRDDAVDYADGGGANGSPEILCLVTARASSLITTLPSLPFRPKLGGHLWLAHRNAFFPCFILPYEHLRKRLPEVFLTSNFGAQSFLILVFISGKEPCLIKAPSHVWLQLSVGTFARVVWACDISPLWTSFLSQSFTRSLEHLKDSGLPGTCVW